MHSDLLAQATAKPVEQRLAEVDELFARQVISSEERDSARTRILGEL